MKTQLLLSDLILFMLVSIQSQAQLSPPTSVTATPSTIYSGNSSNLNATSAGNTIKWYTVATSGTSIGSSFSGTNFSVSPTSNTTYYAEAYRASAEYGLWHITTNNYGVSGLMFDMTSLVDTVTVTAIKFRSNVTLAENTFYYQIGGSGGSSGWISLGSMTSPGTGSYSFPLTNPIKVPGNATIGIKISSSYAGVTMFYDSSIPPQDANDTRVKINNAQYYSDYSNKWISEGSCRAGVTYTTREQKSTSRSSVSVTVTPCTNPTNGGIVSSSQTICSNTIPATLTCTTPGGSYSGDLQYQWQKSTTSASSGFGDISGATNVNYSPGALTANTWYKRLTKVTCLTTPWIESTVVAISMDVSGPTVTAQSNTSTTTVSTEINGNITHLCANATGRGAIIYPYSGTNKIIGDPGVTNSNTPGSYTTGAYIVNIFGLTPGSRYNYRTHATNSYGTGYSDTADFWTLAASPSPPSIINPSATTLDIIINTNGNGSETQYAIQDSVNDKFVQTDGSLNTNPVWHTKATWDTVTVTGLTTAVYYYFRAKARNGDNAESSYSLSARAITLAPPTVTTQAVTIVQTDGATGNGNITSLNGDTVTVRGLIYYEYTDTDKSIGDADVTNVSETGKYGTGSFTGAFTSLLVNNRYNVRAHATNNQGTSYGARIAFYTAANIPPAPVVLNPTATSLDIEITDNSNPDSTQYCIQDSVNSKFVQADGTLDVTAVWQTRISWGRVTVTGLTSAVRYFFQFKARNGDSLETVFGPTGSKYTMAAVPLKPVVSGKTNQSVNVAVYDTINPAETEFAIFETGTSKFVQSDGGLDIDTVFKTRTQWHTDAGSTAKTVSGLYPDSACFFRVMARNKDLVKTDFGDTSHIQTLANVPSPPLVINPAATSLDVSVVVNGNPAHTRYAIQDSANALYVQVNGSCAAAPVWQTAAAWDTVTVTGLATGTVYYFRVMAKNLAGDSTAFGITTARNTCSNPTSGGVISEDQEICYGSTPDPLVNDSDASNYGGILEYQWQSSTTSDTTDFSDISGADTAGYAPGMLTETTWYRRLSRVSCKPDWSDATPSNVVEITVDPTTVGGSVSGDTLVCYGSHTSVLTLSGYTGSVLKWQYSTDGSTWNDIASSASATYSAENLIVDTWYRAVVRSGVCLSENSPSHKIRVFMNYKISGYAKYENNPKTPLSGLKVLLRKGSAIVDSVVTTGAGYYEFDNLTNGTFGLIVKSAHPSGLWQTWGGVNNTDYLLVSKHIAGTQLLPVNSPVIRTTASVKLPHPAINNTDATAIRQAAKFPLTGYTYFDIPKWVFSGTTIATRIDTFELACDDVTRDIRGLCAGDVNGSYVPPTGYKTADPGLELVHRGVLPITDAIIFPVRVDRDMELGAMTLYLDFDPSVMIVTNVTIVTDVTNVTTATTVTNVTTVTTVTTVTNGPELWYNVSDPTLNLKPSTLNTLQIGWISPEPVKVAEGQAVILIHARLRGPVQTHGRASLPSSIRFTLNENPLSEFADGDGNVIGGLKLSMPTAGNSEMAKWRNSEIFVYPNPAHETLNIELETLNPEPETLNLELVNLQGVVVMKREPETVMAGWNKSQFDLRGIAPGVYFLRANLGGEVIVKKIMITR